MKFGSCFGAFGAPENCLERLECEVAGGAISVYLKVRATKPLAAWYEVLRNSKHIRFLYLQPGEVARFTIPAEGSGKQAVAVLHCGHAPHTMRRAARWYDSMTSLRTTHIIQWTPQLAGSVDVDTGETKLSAWSLTGLTYGLTQRVENWATRGSLSVEVTVTGSDVTIDLYSGSQRVATGTGTVGGSVTLSADNGSGLSGSVTVAAGTTTRDELLSVRWPQSVQVKRSSSSPPSSVVATVTFNAADSVTWTEPADLTAGQTYYYAFAFVSDTGVTGSDTSPVAKTIPAPPVSPSDLAYSSGTYAACVLSFTESTTPSATHNCYIQQPSDSVMPTEPDAGAVFAADQVTLPVMEYPGTAQVLVRAVKAGVEEANGTRLSVEFDGSGNYVAPRPNSPAVRYYSAASGLAVTVKGAYPTAGEKGTATKLNLRYKVPGGSYGSIVATAALSVASNGLKVADLAYTLPGAGYYWLKVTAATAADLESEAGAEVLVLVESANPAAVTADSYVARG